MLVVAVNTLTVAACAPKSLGAHTETHFLAACYTERAMASLRAGQVWPVVSMSEDVMSGDG